MSDVCANYKVTGNSCSVGGKPKQRYLENNFIPNKTEYYNLSLA